MKYNIIYFLVCAHTILGVTFWVEVRGERENIGIPFSKITNHQHQQLILSFMGSLMPNFMEKPFQGCFVLHHEKTSFMFRFTHGTSLTLLKRIFIIWVLGVRKELTQMAQDGLCLDWPSCKVALTWHLGTQFSRGFPPPRLLRGTHYA